MTNTKKSFYNILFYILSFDDMSIQKNELLAAVDLGSNSFRLTIAKVVNKERLHQIRVIDSIKVTLRLAAGLDHKKHLNKETIERMIKALGVFGDRIRHFEATHVRAVATSTFRVAKNTPDFLPLAEKALGFPIEVISGQEEARLIYLGVSNELPYNKEKRLVVDIGGGSTECIIGQYYEPIIKSSLGLGCVSYSQLFFPEGKITEKAFIKAQLAAKKEIQRISTPFKRVGWNTAFGSSGTVKYLLNTLFETGLSQDGITWASMKKLKDILVKRGHTKYCQLPGLKEDRQDVFPAGLAIMIAIFEELSINNMYQGNGALRSGVLYDLLGREVAKDKRMESVKETSIQYSVDQEQALRVESLALYFYDQLYPEPQNKSEKELRLLLSWASYLHEVGLSLSQNSYHKHSAYILQHSDMPGMSKAEQNTLSFLALGHTGKLNKLLRERPFPQTHWEMLLCLRLSVLLLRNRLPIDQNLFKLKKRKQNFELSIPQDWIQSHPLIEYTLHLETMEWEKTDNFSFQTRAI